MDMDLSMVQLMQEQVEKLLRATKREGVENLITFLKEHNYYTARCATHHRFAGGLSQHSVEVLLRMQQLNRNKLPMDSIVIVALLHDLCRIAGYTFYKGHGSRSVRILVREALFSLTEDEYQAILWHMHGRAEKGKLGASFDAVLNNPLWQLLRVADSYSAGHVMTRYELRDAVTGKTTPRRSNMLDISPLRFSPLEKEGNDDMFGQAVRISGRVDLDLLHKPSKQERYRTNLAEALQALLAEHGENAVYTELKRQMHQEDIWPQFIKEEYRTPKMREQFVRELSGLSAENTLRYLIKLDSEKKTDFSICRTKKMIYNQLLLLIKPKFKEHGFEKTTGFIGSSL